MTPKEELVICLVESAEPTTGAVPASATKLASGITPHGLRNLASRLMSSCLYSNDNAQASHGPDVHRDRAR